MAADIIIPHPKIGIIESDLQKWKNKPYLGGFRNKKTGVEYFHARSQTVTPQDIQAMVFFIPKEGVLIIFSESKTRLS